MRYVNLRALPVKMVCLGSALLSGAYYFHLGEPIGLWAALGLGAVALAVDLVKPQMMRAVSNADTWMKRLVAAAIFGVLFLASMIAIDGMLLQLRTMLSGPRAQAITLYDQTVAAYQAAVRDLKALEAAGPVRPAAVIEAAMSGAPIDVRIWRRTAHCTDVTKEASKEACAPVTKLREEHARAKRKEDLEQRRDAAQKLLGTLQRPTAADPQAEAIAQMVGQHEATVAYVLVAIIGFAIELVSCFGMWVLGGPAKPASVRASEMRDITPDVEDVEPLPQITTAEASAKAMVVALIKAANGELRTQNRELAAKLGTTPSTLVRWRRAWSDEITSEVVSGVLVLRLKRQGLRLVRAMAS